MSESNQWQSPDRPLPVSDSGFGGYAPGLPVGGQGPGWTPPPKPGLVPLQPMTLGTILVGSFQVMRRNPRPTFGSSLIINGIVALLGLVTVGIVVNFGFGRIADASSTAIDDITAGATAVTILSAIVNYALTLVGAAVLQGIISLEVARATVGEKLSFGRLWTLSRGRVGTLILWSLLSGGAVLLAVGMVTAAIVGFVVATGTDGIVAAVLLSLLALAGLVVLAAWIGTRLSLVPSALLLERLPLVAALRRSWTLTTGFFWRALGIQLLVTVIVATAAQIVVFPVTLIVTIGTTLANPNADPNALDGAFYLSLVITTLVSALVGSVTAIITSATSSLIYIDLRMRKEGLDLTLTRFVEARQTGDLSVADPYLAPVPNAASSSLSSSSPARPAGPDGYDRPLDPSSRPSDSPWA